MTNEEKTNSIVDSNYYTTIGEKNAAYNAALEMATWKDVNFEKILDYIEICYGVFVFNERERFIKKIKELYYDHK